MHQKILKKMGFKPTSHNEIYLDHLEIITDFFIDQCPVESKKALSMLRGSTGISIRYVKEIVDSLLAWGIIKKHLGNYEWMLEGVRPAGIKLEINNEDVPDTIPGDLGEYKPCTFRDENNVCNFTPEKPFTPKVNKCEKCIARSET